MSSGGGRVGNTAYQLTMWTVNASPPSENRWKAWTEPDLNTGVIPLALGSPETFRRIGHSVLTLLIAFVGGVLARWISAERRSDGPGGASL